MDELYNLLEALLTSLAVVGAAALHLALLVIILTSAIVGIAVIRWSWIVFWRATKREWRKQRGKGQQG